MRGGGIGSRQILLRVGGTVGGASEISATWLDRKVRCTLGELLAGEGSAVNEVGEELGST